MKNFIALHTEDGKVHYVDPDHIVSMAADGEREGSLVEITMDAGQPLRPKETLGQILEQLQRIRDLSWEPPDTKRYRPQGDR
jgi:hypothetical protein